MVALRPRLLLGLAAVTAAGCSALTSFDDFVGDGGVTPASSSPPAETSTAAPPPAEDAGHGVDAGAGADASADAAADAAAVDAGVDAPNCVVKSTGFANAAVATAGQGVNAWKDPEKVLSAGGGAAQSGVVVSSFPSTPALTVTDFDFDVPASATVLGVTVRIARSESDAMARDGSVRLTVKNSANRAKNAAWPETLTTATYGGAADTWGVALAPDVVNAPSFGVTMTTTLAAGATFAEPEVDVIQASVTYCE